MSCNCDRDSNGTLVCPEHSNVKPEYERIKQWREYATRVEQHLREYTIPQYGDVGEDAITDYSVRDCTKHVERYAKRFGSQSRDGQQELDFLKMGHYSQCAWEKYVYGVPVEVEAGLPGKMVIVGSDQDDEIRMSGCFDLDVVLTDGDGTKYHFWVEKE